MSFLVGRDGNISVIRAGALVAVIGIIFIVGGLILFTFEQASYQAPLNIDPFPGAVEQAQIPISSTLRRVEYQIPGKTPEEVKEYYQQKLDQLNGADPNDVLRDKCVRLPSEDSNARFLDYVEGSGNVPYYFRCVFNRSGFRLLQTTEVQILPGTYKENAQGEVEWDTRGATVVRYEQQWER